MDQADIDKLLNGDIEQLLAVAKDADEKGLGAGVDNLDDISASTEPQAGSLTDSSTGAPADPTDGIDFDAVPQSRLLMIKLKILRKIPKRKPQLKAVTIPASPKRPTPIPSTPSSIANS